ncbi:MAG TPA: ABC transporter permease [Polyangia bacterium]
MRTIFFIALRHLITRKRQTTVAVAGMAISVIVLVAMTGLMMGFQNKFFTETLKVSPHITVTEDELVPPDPVARRVLGDDSVALIYHARPPERPARIKKPRQVVEAALRLPGVLAGARQLVGQAILAYADKTYPVELRGIEPKLQDTVTPIRGYVVAGRFEALETNLDAIMLGSGVAEKLGAHVGDRITAAGPSGTHVSLKVAALFDTGIPPVDKTRAFVPLRTSQAVLARPDEVNIIGFRIEDTDQAPALAQVIGRLSGYKTESWQEENANWISLFAFQQMISRMVIGFLLVVAAFGILNILIMIVLEKKRDIAILRSIGLTRSQILRIFLVQGSLMGLAGAILGSLGASVVVWAITRVPIHFEGLVKTDHVVMHVEFSYYLWASAFALAAGLVASILPSRRAAATEPVDVLRGQA